MSRTAKYLVALLAVLALVAVACGNSDDDESGGSSDAADEEPEATEEATEEAEPEATEEATEEAAESEEEATEEATEEPEEEASERDTFVAITDVTGVSDEAIEFASVATKTNNPLGTDVADAYNAGIESYFDWRNSEGGIYGRELVLGQKFDDELLMNLQKTTEVIAAENAFGVFSAAQVVSGWPELEEAGIPTWAWGIHAVDANGKEYIWGHAGGVACTTCTSRAVPYFAGQAGATSAASLGYGISQNSKDCAQAVASSFERYEADTGVASGYVNDNLEFGLGNGIAVEVSEMRDAGVDFISTCMDLNGMKTLAQELERQGMTDVTLYHPNTYNQAFVAEADPLFEGDYVGVAFVPFEANAVSEQQGKYFEFMEARGVEPSELAFTGWINADQAFTALLLAGPDFDRQSVTDGFNAVTDYDDDAMLNPVDWTRQKVPPTPDDPVTNGSAANCFAVVQIVDAEFEVFGGDPSTPWLCWPNTMEQEMTEPELVTSPRDFIEGQG
jgi:hypothetical protein